MNPMNKTIPLLVAAVATALAGCSAVVRTPYERPVLVTPAQWNVVSAEVPAVDDGRW